MKHRGVRCKYYLNPATWQLLKQLSVGIVSLVAVGLLVTSIWYLTRLETVTISKLEIAAGETIPVGVVEAIANDALQGEYFKLIPRRFAWWYPESDITQAITALERVKTVTVKRTKLDTLSIRFTEYVPDALWCKMASPNECLFLDKTGLAFGRAPVLVGGSLIRYYSLQLEPELFAQPFLTEDYTKTKVFAELLSPTGWFVSQIEIDSVRDVFFTLTGGAEVKGTLLEEPERLFAYLETIRQSDKFAHLRPDNFQYVDIRFGTKIFINENLIEAEPIEVEVELTVPVVPTAPAPEFVPPVIELPV